MKIVNKKTKQQIEINSMERVFNSAAPKEDEFIYSDHSIKIDNPNEITSQLIPIIERAISTKNWLGVQWLLGVELVNCEGCRTKLISQVFELATKYEWQELIQFLLVMAENVFVAPSAFFTYENLQIAAEHKQLPLTIPAMLHWSKSKHLPIGSHLLKLSLQLVFDDSQSYDLVQQLLQHVFTQYKPSSTIAFCLEQIQALLYCVGQQQQMLLALPQALHLAIEHDYIDSAQYIIEHYYATREEIQEMLSPSRLLDRLKQEPVQTCRLIQAGMQTNLPELRKKLLTLDLVKALVLTIINIDNTSKFAVDIVENCQQALQLLLTDAAEKHQLVPVLPDMSSDILLVLLLIAAKYDHLKIIKDILECCTVKPDMLSQALKMAVQNKSKNVVHYLFNYDKDNLLKKEELLEIASKVNYSEVVYCLLGRHAVLTHLWWRDESTQYKSMDLEPMKVTVESAQEKLLFVLKIAVEHKQWGLIQDLLREFPLKDQPMQMAILQAAAQTGQIELAQLIISRYNSNPEIQKLLTYDELQKLSSSSYYGSQVPTLIQAALTSGCFNVCLRLLQDGVIGLLYKPKSSGELKLISTIIEDGTKTSGEGLFNLLKHLLRTYDNIVLPLKPILLCAIRNEWAGLIQELLPHQQKLTAIKLQALDFNALLKEAAGKRLLNIVEWLLDCYPQEDDYLIQGWNLAFQAAASNGDQRLLQLLLQRCKPKECLRFDLAFAAAAGKDQIKTMNILADQCVELKTELSITLALQAAIKNNQLQAIKFITQKYDVPIENIWEIIKKYEEISLLDNAIIDQVAQQVMDQGLRSVGVEEELMGLCSTSYTMKHSMSSYQSRLQPTTLIRFIQMAASQEHKGVVEHILNDSYGDTQLIQDLLKPDQLCQLIKQDPNQVCCLIEMVLYLCRISPEIARLTMNWQPQELVASWIKADLISLLLNDAELDDKIGDKIQQLFTKHIEDRMLENHNNDSPAEGDLVEDSDCMTFVPFPKPNK